MTSPVPMVPGAGAANIAVTATIANAASLSGAVDLGPGRTLAAIQMPAAWTAAGLTFQVSFDNVTFFNAFSETAEYLVSTASTGTGSQTVLVDRTKWDAIRYVKVRSGPSATPVAQGAQRVLTMVTLPSKS